MDRVFQSGAVASPPSAPASPSTGYPTKGDPVGGIPATVPGEYWYHMVTEEMRAVIASAGLTPDHTNTAQVAAAIEALIEARVGDFSLDTGIANAYVVALNPVLSQYTVDFTGRAKLVNANTGACTIDFGPGPVPLVKHDGTALSANDLPAACVISYQYIHVDGKAYITSTVGGLNLSSPPPVGDVSPSTGKFTTLEATGVLTLTSGQIKFPATAIPSADPNTLDAYEEGSFLPDNGATTMDIQFGTYVKVGKACTFQGGLRPTNMGTGSSSSFGGLPFTAEAGNGAQQGGNINYGDGWGLSVFDVSLCITGTSCAIHGHTAASTIKGALAGFLVNGARIIFSGQYITAS